LFQHKKSLSEIDCAVNSQEEAVMHTRARDQLLVCGVEPKSEFLKDFA